MDVLSQLYANIDAWLANYRTAHPEDDRADLDILLDRTVYTADSPYWPPRQDASPARAARPAARRAC